MDIFTYANTTLLFFKYLRESEHFQKDAFEFYTSKKELPKTFFNPKTNTVEKISIQNIRNYNSVFADEFDALRHGYISFKFTQKYSAEKTKTVQDLNEYRTSGFFENIKIGDWKFATSWNSPADRNKDLWNNSISRQLGLKYAGLNDKTILQALMKDIDERKNFIVDPNDLSNPKYQDTKFWQDKWDKADRLWEQKHGEDKSILTTPTTPKDFSKLQPAKLDELKNPTVQGISGAMGDTTTTPINIIQPQPIHLGQNTTSWLHQLGGVLNILGSVVGSVAGLSLNNTTNTGQLGVKINGQSYTGKQFPLKHTGGKISGKDEVLAILRGGETVRTKAQEEELQQEKHKQIMEAIRPYLEQNEKPKTIEQAYDPNNKIPCLLNKTTHDEELIISIIAQAWKTNRLGLRNVIRYE